MRSWGSPCADEQPAAVTSLLRRMDAAPIYLVYELVSSHNR
jgi:hypothetical protein